jgi:predicted GH43/DUF377 family glycosyl hydrolase
MDTPDGIWMLSLNRRTNLVRAIVVDRSHPPDLLWRSRVRLRRGRGRALTAQLAWRKAKVVVRLDGSSEVRVTLSLLLSAQEPMLLPRAPPRTVLERIAMNPILEPNSANAWESLAVFNTAAIKLDDRVHLLYRAIGNEGISVFGCASSHDGTQIDERIGEPVYMHDCANGNPAAISSSRCEYRSGISHVGCEDPRLTRIGERLYMTYTAFDGCNPPSVALASIAKQDFMQRRWNWSAPVSISATGQAHKNWVLFPEKIGGRFALLHGISPSMQIEYLDDLDFRDGAAVQSRYCCSGSEKSWDNRIRGVGPPPIRTEVGWLLLYHAMDERDPGRYKVGAMLLDLLDPSCILGRLPHPLLAPDARYENEGCKSGVVYTCGAIQAGERLLVYYGGADTVVCVATLELKQLLAQIVSAQSRPPRDLV